MSKIITVFGATGNQGGSLISHLLKDAALAKEYKVRAVTRDQSKPAAKALADKGCELVNADLNSVDSIAKAITGSHTVFLVTNYWETADPAVERNQGHNLADAAKQTGVKHILFSSLMNVTEATNGRLSHVPHFDGKAEIASYIKSTGIPCTFILPGYYMSNLLDFIKKDDGGVYNLSLPLDEASAQFPLFATSQDLGKFTNAMLKHAARLGEGSEVLAATAYYTIPQILSTIESVTGAKTRYNKITQEEYKSYMPPAVGQEFLENHLLLEGPGYYGGRGLEDSLALLEEKPTTWEEFIKLTGAFK